MWITIKINKDFSLKLSYLFDRKAIPYQKWGASNIGEDGPVPGCGDAVLHKVGDNPMIDRTYKMYYAGGQKRPDGNYCRAIKDSNGKVRHTKHFINKAYHPLTLL